MPFTPLIGPAVALGWNWLYAYGLLSSRTIKQIYGIDHNSSPRQDLNKYAEQAIRDGKVTRKQVDQIHRFEAASANSVEGYTLFVGSVLFALHARVPIKVINTACAVYSLARLFYGVVYVMIDDDVVALLRSLSWWTGNLSCLFLFYKGASALE